MSSPLRDMPPTIQGVQSGARQLVGDDLGVLYREAGSNRVPSRTGAAVRRVNRPGVPVIVTRRPGGADRR